MPLIAAFVTIFRFTATPRCLRLPPQAPEHWQLPFDAAIAFIANATAAEPALDAAEDFFFHVCRLSRSAAMPLIYAI